MRTDFFIEPVKDCKSCESYRRGRSLVTSLEVINFSAERGIKLALDFLPGAINEINYQNIL